MGNYSKILSFSSFLILSLLFISCDSLKTELSNKSLIGEKITSQNSNVFYSINKEANKAKELQNQIKQHIDNIRNNNNSFIDVDGSVQEPNLDEAMLVVNTDIDKKYILLPINTSSKTKKIASVIRLNSETNSFSKKPLFITETKNLPESEHPNNVTVMKISDHSGNIMYNSETNHRKRKGNNYDQTSGWWDCVAYMTDKLEGERPESLNEVCEAGLLSCNTIEFGEAAVRCTVGEY